MKIVLFLLLLLVICTVFSTADNNNCPTSVSDASTTCQYGSYTKTFTIDNTPCPTVTLCCEEPQRDNVPDCLEWNKVMCADDQCIKAYICKTRCPTPAPKDPSQLHTCKSWENDYDANTGCQTGYKCSVQCPPATPKPDNVDCSEWESVIGSDGCLQSYICKDNIHNCPDPEKSKEGQCCSGPNQQFVLSRTSNNDCPVYMCQCKPKDTSIVCARGQSSVDSIDSDGCEYRECKCQNKAENCPNTICEGRFSNARVTLEKNFENKCITECACQLQTRKCLSDIHIGDTKTERQCCTQTKSYDMLSSNNNTPEVTYQCDKTVCETTPFTTDMIQFSN
jgi:hypothetical protein